MRPFQLLLLTTLPLRLLTMRPFQLLLLTTLPLRLLTMRPFQLLLPMQWSFVIRSMPVTR